MRNKIKSIRLINFKTYVDETISFSKFTNAITGETDNGKTNILRAMKWVLWNQPSGDGMIRLGENSAMVIIEFIDGLMITRERSIGGSVNRYIIRYPDRTQTTLNKFGINVPDEVLQAHKMIPVMFNTEKCILNYAEQLDGPFMLKYSKRDRAKAIGALAGTDVVDSAITDTRKDAREGAMEYKIIASQVKENQDKISDFENLEEMASLLNQVNIIYSNIISNLESVSLIKKIQAKLSEDSAKLSNLNVIVKELKNLDIFEDDCDELSKNFIIKQNICKINTKLLEEKQRIIELDKKLKSCENVDVYIRIVEELSNSFSSISELIKLSKKFKLSTVEFNSAKNTMESIPDLVDAEERLADIQKSILNYSSINIINSKIVESSIRYKSKQDSFNEIVKDLNLAISDFESKLSQFKRCPFCFSDINEETISNISTKIGEE